MNRINVIIRGVGVTVVAGVLATGAYIVNEGGGDGEFPNTTAANVFVDDSGNDAGANCERYAEPLDTPPTASTVCETWAQAYSLASLGDTVWVLPGTYTGDEFPAGTTGKSLAGNDCHDTNECVYFIPQPGQEANVNLALSGLSSLDVDGPTNHLYLANFEDSVCPSVGYASSAGNFPRDITFDNIKGIQGTDAADGCTFGIDRDSDYIRILNSEFSYNCTSGTSGGSVIGNDPSTAANTTPGNIELRGNYIHDFVINEGGGSCGPAEPHQDCVHVYAMMDSVIADNVFDRCYDSSILLQAYDGPEDDNNIIENNWFGPTIGGTNNCCMRGDPTPANETFDAVIIRFNSISGGSFINKTQLVLNGVYFVGNASTGAPACVGSGATYAYNVYSGTECDADDIGGQSNSTIKFTNIDNGTLDLHVASDSVVLGVVPGAQTNGCAAAAVDKDGDARGSPCDAGADER